MLTIRGEDDNIILACQTWFAEVSELADEQD